MKKLIATILSVASIATAAILPASAITMSDKPITGGNTIFTQEELMYTGEPAAASKWSNAFCNEDWTGCTWTAATEDGIDCIKVVPAAGKSKFYMDFNYYQWNNDKYYPSLDCSEYKFIKVKYKLNDAGASMATADKTHFWASQDSPELSKTLATAEADFTGFSNKANVWQTVTLDLSGLNFASTKWSDATVRQFRYYPFGNASAAVDGAVCYIEYIAFFKTKAEADAYQGPAAEAAAAAAAAAAANEKAAQTADPIALTVLAGAAALGMAVVIGKKRAR
ncbi:MAG: hypothetical protein IJ493_06650 [Clostridia bacterium]|nr:hypothetical protein [Clostridia bacterium]